jgi:TM2 domain-containing membrane protein YozV
VKASPSALIILIITDLKGEILMEPKKKLVAGLLGLFLGGLGIHNFYLGNTKRAIIQIIVSVCTCGLGALWGEIEGILILIGKINTDADGNPLVD